MYCLVSSCLAFSCVAQNNTLPYMLMTVSNINYWFANYPLWCAKCERVQTRQGEALPTLEGFFKFWKILCLCRELKYSHHIPVSFIISLSQCWSIQLWDYIKILLFWSTTKISCRLNTQQLACKHILSITLLRRSRDQTSLWGIQSTYSLFVCANIRWIPKPHNAVCTQLIMFACVIQMEHFICKEVSGTN